MKWIKTQEGKLINLEQVTGIEYKFDGDLPASVWLVGASIYACAFAGTVEACEAYMCGLEHELGAIGCQQVLGNGRVAGEALS